MPTLKADSAALERAARVLAQGGLVGMPTETVYGLAADAFNAAACARIFEVKKRPSFDPLIVHLAGAHWLPRVVSRFTGAAERLAEAFWPGPLTLVLPKVAALPHIVTAGLPTVAVRVPAHPTTLALLHAVDRPLAAPSANPFGGLSPTTAAHVERGLGYAVDLVLDGGPCMIGVESTIVDVSTDAPCLLRPGGLERERIEEVLGRSLIVAPSVLDRPLAPGQLASHYAPRTPLEIDAGRPAPPRTGLLALRPPSDGRLFAQTEVLSDSGDLREAAAHLFDALHRLDDAGLDRIFAAPVPEVGLGLAIMDRLRKAAAGR
jgi:L-threonylcarbamoyladenylate synthase